MLAPPQGRGYRGSVIWKPLVSGLVAAILAAAPAAAAVCAASCIDHGGAHRSLPSGDPHAHHGAAAATAPGDATFTGTAHACDDHERIATPPTIIEREGTSAPSPTASQGPVYLTASIRPTPAPPPVGAAEGPPGTQGVTTVSVLRI